MRVKDSSKGSDLAKVPQHSYFGVYQTLLNTCSNVWYQAASDQKVIWYILKKQRFLDLLSQFRGHHEFYMERALSTRRLYKRLSAENHKEIMKCYNAYQENEVQSEHINVSMMSRIIKEVKRRKSILTSKKAESYCVDK